MNRPLNLDDESHWALVAQAIPECTPMLQLSLLESLQSYRQLFDSSEQVADASLNQQLQLLRKEYRSGQWQLLVDAINTALTNTQAQTVPITTS